MNETSIVAMVPQSFLKRGMRGRSSKEELQQCLVEKSKSGMTKPLMLASSQSSQQIVFIGYVGH